MVGGIANRIVSQWNNDSANLHLLHSWLLRISVVHIVSRAKRNRSIVVVIG